MNESIEAKREIRELYNELGREKAENAENWLTSGDAVNVTETAAGDYFLDRKLRTALELANPGKASRVLEIGTQYGYLGFRLAASGFEVDAVDVSTEAIELARERVQRLEVGGLRFTVQDAENLNEGI